MLLQSKWFFFWALWVNRRAEHKITFTFFSQWLHFGALDRGVAAVFWWFIIVMRCKKCTGKKKIQTPQICNLSLERYTLFFYLFLKHSSLLRKDHRSTQHEQFSLFLYLAANYFLQEPQYFYNWEKKSDNCWIKTIDFKEVDGGDWQVTSPWEGILREKGIQVSWPF